MFKDMTKGFVLLYQYAGELLLELLCELEKLEDKELFLIKISVNPLLPLPDHLFVILISTSF